VPFHIEFSLTKTSIPTEVLVFRLPPRLRFYSAEDLSHMASSPQKSAIEEYLQWEDRARVEVIADLTIAEKTYFLPIENARNYFGANDCKILRKILKEIFFSEHLPVDVELILRDLTAILCILLRIGHGSAIQDFAYFEELFDGRLPFDSTHPPLDFPGDTGDALFLHKFCEEQWMYCVPAFNSHMLHKRFGTRRILPITHQRPHDPSYSGVGKKYIIDLYEPLNKLIPAGRTEVRILLIFNSTSKIFPSQCD
jgi:hypothetical protein